MAGLALPVENRLFTYADYKQWELAPGERYELIYGEAYAMSAPNDQHQAILVALAAEFYNFLKGKPCKVRPAPYDVRLFYQEDEGDDTVVQPDITVICDEKKRGPEGCRGAPDLVVEIVSPSNRAEEMFLKFNLYRDAGVREFWVVNPKDRTLLAHRFEGAPMITRFYKSADTVSTELLPGLEIPLGPVFAE